MTDTHAPATAAGPTDVALLDDTIGDNLRRTIAAHGANEALVARHQGLRWTYDELGARVERLSAGLMGLGLEAGDRVGLWSPNYAEWTLLQYATADIGVILVNINPAYRTHELAYVARAVGLPHGVRRAVVQDVGLRGDGRPGRGHDARRSSGRCSSGRTTGTRSSPGAAAPATTRSRRGGRRCGPTTRSTSSTRRAPPGFPKGATLTHRNILNNGYFVTRLQQLHAGRPAVHPGALLPLLRHGHGQPRLHHARGDDGHPLRRVRPGARARDGRRPSACTALYGVPTMFIAELARPDFERLRPVVAAHRGDGRLAVPGRGDEGVRRPHAHGRRHDLLRDDRDLAGVDPDAARRLAAPPHRDRRPGPPPRRDAHRRPGDRRHGRARRDRRVLHARLLGDAAATGTTRRARPRRSTPTGGCTPATWR